MQDKHCAVCGSVEWNYDVIDRITGWVFCRDCFQLVEDVFQEYYEAGEGEVDAWLKAIPEAHRRMKAGVKDEEPVET